MGVFDLFGKDKKVGGDRSERRNGAFRRNDTERKSAYFSEREDYGYSPKDENADEKNPVAVFMPSSYDEVEKIIDALKANKTAVVHLTELKTETAIRILDMLSGAIYALGGGVYEMQKNIFMFSPCGVEVHEG